MRCRFADRDQSAGIADEAGAGTGTGGGIVSEAIGHEAADMNGEWASLALSATAHALHAVRRVPQTAADDRVVNFDSNGEYVVLDIRMPEIRAALVELLATRGMARYLPLVLLRDPLPPPRQAAARPLTARELEVLTLIMDGLRNKVIADRLGISMRTVESHRASILKKMQVKNAVQLAGLFERP